MAVTLDLYDPYDRAAMTINREAVRGPLRGYRGLRYVQRGAIRNAAGTCSFELPMGLRANAPIGVRTVVRVTDDVYGLVGTYMVGESSERLAEDSRYRAFTCLDLVSELALDTVPGLSALPNETTIATLQRLLLVPFQTPYTAKMVNGTDYYAGIDFLADNVTVQAAFSKLLSDRNFAWRRGDGRVIEFGTLKRATGIRLVQASKRPAAMDRPLIRPIPTGGLTRAIDPAAIYNCIAITGAGDGPYQHSLQPLYTVAGETAVPGTNWYKSGPLDPAKAFVGYDPGTPIHRRITYNGRGSDGYEYFLLDWDSINRYRPSFYPLNRSDVGSTENTADDLVETAQALYIIAWATLQTSAKPNTALAVSTIGRGTNVGVGGDTVALEWDEYDDDGNYLPDQSFNRAPFVVLSVETAVDDATGATTDTWQLSDIGRAIQDDTATQTGMLESLSQIRNAVTIYPMEKDYHRDEPITPASPVVLHINLTQRVQKVQVARFNLQLKPLYATVTGGTVAGHSHSVKFPLTTYDASVPYTYEQGYNPGSQANYSHTDDITANRSARNFTDNITAGRSGGVTKSGSVTGGGNVSDSVTNNGAFFNHGHATPIFQGTDPTSGNQTLWYNFSSHAINTKAGADGQGPKTTGPLDIGTGNNHNHGHGTSSVVSDGSGVNDGLGVSRGGTLADNLGVSRGGVGVGAHPGFQPDSRFPGNSNVITKYETAMTEQTVAPGFTPLYGKYDDAPGNLPTNVRFLIGGAVVAGPFNSDQVGIDLSPYLQVRTPVDILITSESKGRIILDGEIEASKTIYGMAS